MSHHRAQFIPDIKIKSNILSAFADCRKMAGKRGRFEISRIMMKYNGELSITTLNLDELCESLIADCNDASGN